MKKHTEQTKPAKAAPIPHARTLTPPNKAKVYDLLQADSEGGEFFEKALHRPLTRADNTRVSRAKLVTPKPRPR